MSTFEQPETAEKAKFQSAPGSAADDLAAVLHEAGYSRQTSSGQGQRANSWIHCTDMQLDNYEKRVCGGKDPGLNGEFVVTSITPLRQIPVHPRPQDDGRWIHCENIYLHNQWQKACGGKDPGLNGEYVIKSITPMGSR